MLDFFMIIWNDLNAVIFICECVTTNDGHPSWTLYQILMHKRSVENYRLDTAALINQ